MIIDCHGHYTTAPEPHQTYRQGQIDALADSALPPPDYGTITDDQIRESVESNQLKLQRERGADLTLFSPRASAMGHHIGTASTSLDWARACNNLIKRVTDLYPDNFAPVCQLPQTAGASLDGTIAELERCVNELGFVGCNLNPDPSGGHWTSPPLTDRFWYPVYERMVDLDVPAMIHVSASCNPNFHATGAHYINADTTAFMQFIQADLFADFPQIRFIIPHHVMNNVWFDTCVYHQPGIDCLFEVIPSKNILFGSEMVGAVRGIDPETGQFFDDTKRYIDALDVDDAVKADVFEHNVRRVYPRLDAQLKKAGR